MSTKMKNCKTCGEEIAKNAKVCPKCGARQKGHLGLIIAVVVIILLVITAIGKDGNDSSKDNKPSPSASSASGTTEEAVKYTEVSVDEMLKALDENAAAASDSYKGQYLAVTGKLSNIDAQGDYISLDGSDDLMYFTGCQCYIRGDKDIYETVKTLSKGDVITVKGEITDVGEVFGYSMAIHEIVK